MDQTWVLDGLLIQVATPSRRSMNILEVVRKFCAIGLC
jgi:hypothetical protein